MHHKMTPEQILRVTLAAQREALFSSQSVLSSVAMMEACFKTPQIADTLIANFKTLAEGNSWEAHLAAIDALIAAARR